MALALKEKYGNDYKIPTTVLPKFVVKIGSFFSSDMAHIVKEWDRQLTFDTSDTTGTLQIEFRDIKTSLQEMAETLIECGYIPDKRDGKGKKNKKKKAPA